MKEESKPSVEERIELLEVVVNKIAEEQVLIEDALKTLKNKLEVITTANPEDAYKCDMGGISINEEI